MDCSNRGASLLSAVTQFTEQLTVGSKHFHNLGQCGRGLYAAARALLMHAVSARSHDPPCRAAQVLTQAVHIHVFWLPKSLMLTHRRSSVCVNRLILIKLSITDRQVEDWLLHSCTDASSHIGFKMM